MENLLINTAMDFKVDKGIPIPDDGPSWRQKLDLLEKGESFPFPREKKNSVRQNVTEHFHSNPGTTKTFRVSCKKNDLEGRVWRIK